MMMLCTDSATIALILTTDFFTPIVDRPHDFGAVAAANALSNVYAMGGVSLSALSLVGFPSGALPSELLIEILRGLLRNLRKLGLRLLAGIPSRLTNQFSVWLLSSVQSPEPS